MPSIHQQPLTEVVTAIQQRWGEKALRRLAQVKTDDAEGISTGYAALDRLLGRNGVPRGALTCLSGQPTSGMTTLALNVLARTQAEGEVTVYIDANRTLDPAYVSRRGINLERLLVVRPQPRALGLDIARDIVTRDGAGVVVLDLGQPLPGVEVQPGQAIRSLRRLIMSLHRSPYAVIGLSAVPDHLSAAVISYASLYLQVERLRWLRDNGRVSGYEVRVTTLKNRFALPDQATTFNISLNAPEQRQGP